MALLILLSGSLLLKFDFFFMRTGALGKGMSLDARGKFARGGGFGRISFGYNYFGFYSWYSGIYQKLYIWGKPYISRKKFNWGSNPQTEVQQLWRSVIASGVLEWQSFTSDQKLSYNARARGLTMSGYNLFLREWLNSHKDLLS